MVYPLSAEISSTNVGSTELLGDFELEKVLSRKLKIKIIGLELQCESLDKGKKRKLRNLLATTKYREKQNDSKMLQQLVEVIENTQQQVR